MPPLDHRQEGAHGHQVERHALVRNRVDRHVQMLLRRRPYVTSAKARVRKDLCYAGSRVLHLTGRVAHKACRGAGASGGAYVQRADVWGVMTDAAAPPRG